MLNPDDAECLLHNACAAGQATHVALILQHLGYEFNINALCQNLSETALGLACRFGNTECVRVLLQNNNKHALDVNQKNDLDETPLFVACLFGHFECITELLMGRIQQLDVDHICGSDQISPLQLVCTKHADTSAGLTLSTLLLQNGADCSNIMFSSSNTILARCLKDHTTNYERMRRITLLWCISGLNRRDNVICQIFASAAP